MGRVKQPAIRRETSETITNGVLYQDVNGLIHEPKEQIAKMKHDVQDSQPGLGSLLFCVGGIYASL